MQHRAEGRTRVYVVDSLTDDMASLIGDNSRQVTIARDQLPSGVAEGTVLRVPEKDDGTPDWPNAHVDAAETERRLDEARSIIKELRKRDPGGDIEL